MTIWIWVATKDDREEPGDAADAIIGAFVSSEDAREACLADWRGRQHDQDASFDRGWEGSDDNGAWFAQGDEWTSYQASRHQVRLS